MIPPIAQTEAEPGAFFLRVPPAPCRYPSTAQTMHFQTRSKLILGFPNFAFRNLLKRIFVKFFIQLNILISAGNEDNQNSSHDGKKFGKCTWCKNFGNLNDYSSNLQGREIYCTGLCSKSCFEQAALKILNVEAGYGLETTSFPASVPIRTSLDSISRHEHRLSRDRCKDRRFYDRPQYEDDQTRFDAASNGAAQLSPVIKTPPFNESSQTYWNIENVKSLRPGEVVNSAKQGNKTYLVRN